MSSTPRIAWRNLWRNPGRTALCAFAIAFSQLAVVFTSAFFRSYLDSIALAITGPMIGAVQVHAAGWRENREVERALPDADALKTAVTALAGVKSVSERLYAPALVAAGDDAKVALLVGVEAGPEQEGGLLAGVPDAERPEGKRVLLGASLADRLGVKPGGEIALVGQGADGSVANDLYRVAGLLRSPMQEVERNGVVMALPAAREFLVLPGQAHELVVRALPGADDRELAARISALPALSGREVLSWRQLLPIMDRLLQMAGWGIAITMLLVFAASATGIANTMMMSVFERRRETGMLLALGSSPVRIVSMLAAEATALGGLGVVAGSVAGGGLTLYAGWHGIDLLALAGGNMAFQGINFMGVIHPRLAAPDILWGAAVVLGTTLLAMLWPAIGAARMQPAEGLRA